jgi:tubulin gamma
LASLISPLIPTPKCHFLITSYTPFTSKTNLNGLIRKTSVLDIITRLLSPKNIIYDHSLSEGKFINVLNIIKGKIPYIIKQGDSFPTDILKSIERINEKELVNLVDWNTSGMKFSFCKKSSYFQTPKLSGLMMANHSSINLSFQKILKDFDKLYKKKAFINNYQKYKLFSDNLDEFEDSKNVVNDVIDEYNKISSKDYFENLINNV